MDHEIARLLANRDDFDTALLAPAFFDLPEAERLMVIHAFEARKTPDAPIKKTIEQISVATKDLTRALMKLYTENRRPEVTRLLSQITGLDEVRCGQIAHDTSGAALFVVLRAFSCTAYDGLKVLIHATSHDRDRSQALERIRQAVPGHQPGFDGLSAERLARRGRSARSQQAGIPARDRLLAPRRAPPPGRRRFRIRPSPGPSPPSGRPASARRAEPAKPVSLIAASLCSGDRLEAVVRLARVSRPISQKSLSNRLSRSMRLRDFRRWHARRDAARTAGRTSCRS